MHLYRDRHQADLLLQAQPAQQVLDARTAIDRVVVDEAHHRDFTQTQPGPEFFHESIGGQADQMGAFAEATSIDDLYARLEKAGFMLDFGDDGSGLFMKYLRRGSGYYIDVGASELVANGSIKLKSGVNIERIHPRSVTLTDGTELPADVIVYATGFGSMNHWLADLVSPEVADRVGKVWGLGSSTTKDPGPWEGELRNMWKPTHQPQLWVHGGNLHQSRHYSQFLSLQLKARMEGLDTPVYAPAAVHHVR